MKSVIFLAVLFLAGCSDAITIRPLPTNDYEFENTCVDRYTAPPNNPIHIDAIVLKCQKIVREYNERRIKEGKVPYQNDSNLLFWYLW